MLDTASLQGSSSAIYTSWAAKTWTGTTYRSQTEWLKPWDNIQERIALLVTNGICFEGVRARWGLTCIAFVLTLFEETRENKEYKGKQKVRWDQQADEGGWGQRGNNWRQDFCITAAPLDLQGEEEGPHKVTLHKPPTQNFPDVSRINNLKEKDRFSLLNKNKKLKKKAFCSLYKWTSALSLQY